MDKYFLFRDNTLVGTNEPDSMGAGSLHDRGQEGDVLILLGKQGLEAWLWVNSDARKGVLPWQECFLTTEQYNYYQTLLLVLA